MDEKYVALEQALGLLQQAGVDPVTIERLRETALKYEQATRLAQRVRPVLEGNKEVESIIIVLEDRLVTVTREGVSSKPRVRVTKGSGPRRTANRSEDAYWLRLASERRGVKYFGPNACSEETRKLAALLREQALAQKERE